ncbi:MAG: DNA glycosylase AlkZ-like family protein [Desulforhopalus sp.]
MLKLSKKDARRLLVLHHFKPASLQGAFERLGSVQYDPLNPVGQNHDLVLQARVPGYSVGDWQKLAYQDRFLYDAWDKQASLVMMRDYPVRRIYYDWQTPRWREAILEQYPEAVKTVLGELNARGPLSSIEFHYQKHHKQWEGSWYGPKLTKNVLRALWHTGKIHTTRRNKGKHVYDLAGNVVPRHLFEAEPIPAAECINWLILQRHKALGLMRPNAGTAVWSLGISTSERRKHLQELLHGGTLVAVNVDGIVYHALPRTLEHLDKNVKPKELQIRFVAPLDQLMWDRPAVAHLFNFDYVWEVYKPKTLRRWGYYVLPVMLGDDFVARIDSSMRNGVWQVHQWYWEDDVECTREVLDAIEQAFSQFRRYLGAESLKLPRGLTRPLRGAFKAGFKV